MSVLGTTPTAAELGPGSGTLEGSSTVVEAENPHARYIFWFRRAGFAFSSTVVGLLQKACVCGGKKHARRLCEDSVGNSRPRPIDARFSQVLMNRKHAFFDPNATSYGVHDSEMVLGHHLKRNNITVSEWWCRSRILMDGTIGNTSLNSALSLTSRPRSSGPMVCRICVCLQTHVRTRQQLTVSSTFLQIADTWKRETRNSS